MTHKKSKQTLVLSALLATTFTLSSCAQMFQSKLPMEFGSNTTLGTLFEKEDEISQLETPKQVFVSQGQSSSQILLSWDQVEGATSYTIERAIVKDSTITTAPDESEFQIIQKFVYDTTYTDNVIDSNANYLSDEYQKNYKYYYRIIAQNPRKSYDPSLPTTPVCGTLFNPVLNVTADLGKATDSINIYWDEVKNATKYQIWRGVNSNGTSMEKIATAQPTYDYATNKLFFKNAISSSEQGIEFYYKVIAENNSGNQSINSPIAMGFSLMSGAPVAPNNVKVSNGRGTKSSIKITWDPVVAESTTYYTIYRTSSVDSSLTLLNSKFEGTSFTDTKGLKPNEYYYYQIQSFIVDSETQEKLKSPMSDTGKDSKTPAEGFILSAPNNVKVSKTDSGALYLSWESAIGNSDEQNAYTYKIYCSQNEKDEYLICDDNVPTIFQDDGRIYAQVSKTANFYKISTFYNGIESQLSQAVAPSPNPAQNIIVSKNANLGSDKVANSNGVYPVEISWNAPSDTSSLSSYHVYRSTKKESGFRKITETPISHTSGTNTYSYIDSNETAKTRTNYYYKVLAVNSLEQGQEYSSTDYGYGALTPEQYMREYNKTAINSQTKLTLMHKSNDLDKLGSESVTGSISGSLSYNAKTQGLGARITMHYDNYADYYIDENNKELGIYFLITGDTNTTASMDASGNMDGTVVCTGMYPGSVIYDKIVIKGGAAGGGTYGIIRQGFDGQVQVDWTIGEEGR